MYAHSHLHTHLHIGSHIHATHILTHPAHTLDAHIRIGVYAYTHIGVCTYTHVYAHDYNTTGNIFFVLTIPNILTLIFTLRAK